MSDAKQNAKRKAACDPNGVEKVMKSNVETGSFTHLPTMIDFYYDPGGAT